MSDNPYAPPAATSDPSGTPPRRGSALLAVAIGWVTDIVGTTIFSAVAILCIGIMLGADGATDGELAALEQSSGWRAFGLVFGMGFTALGGYVTARIANYSEYRLAALMGLSSLVTGEILIQMGEPESSLFWVRLVGFVFTLPAALGGAWWYLQRKHSS
ncbi:MAG: hypothetical protein EXR39_05845 [Betaproteobacteria bacterium]|nr:hypothetical protein [Betaproteobacteria bacterium]